jgi:hypothetical protein
VTVLTRAWHTDARIEGCTDRTVYGASSPTTCPCHLRLMSLAEARRSGRHDGAGVARRAASAADPARVPGESQKISCKRAPRVAVVRAAQLAPLY